MPLRAFELSIVSTAEAFNFRKIQDVFGWRGEYEDLVVRRFACSKGGGLMDGPVCLFKVFFKCL